MSFGDGDGGCGGYDDVVAASYSLRTQDFFLVSGSGEDGTG